MASRESGFATVFEILALLVVGYFVLKLLAGIQGGGGSAGLIGGGASNGGSPDSLASLLPYLFGQGSSKSPFSGGLSLGSGGNPSGGFGSGSGNGLSPAYQALENLDEQVGADEENDLGPLGNIFNSNESAVDSFGGTIPYAPVGSDLTAFDNSLSFPLNSLSSGGYTGPELDTNDVDGTSQIPVDDGGDGGDDEEDGD